MDPTPLPPLPTTISAAAAADSIASTPASRPSDPVDDPLPKLRLMCSFGGHILPRPHDKSLCYVGGETRIVVLDRNSSLSSICSRLSRTLLNGRPFTLKYQLPNEDLDSLISVTSDEDLENMIEEYDRVSAASKSARIRLFLFFVKPPETAMSMEALLDDAKSESWFVDALNNAGALPRGFSDSAAMDNLLNLDDGIVVKSDSCGILEGQVQVDKQQAEKSVSDLHSMPNSPLVEKENGCSSFGSSSSSPPMANLPPIRTRVEDNGAKVEEQLAQMSAAQRQDDGYVVVSAAAGGVHPIGVSGEGMSIRVLSDEERCDQGAPVGMRKPPLPVQHRTGGGGGYNLPSPDSVASDASIASANSFSKQIFYQDQGPVAPRDCRTPASPSEKSDSSVQHPQVQMQQVQVSSYMLPSQGDQQPRPQQQQQQQQFIHAGAHYMPHPPTGQVPIQSYYQMYAPQRSQQQLHHPLDHQYPVYVMPTVQSQAYNMSMQSKKADTTTPTVVASNTLGSPNPALVATHAAYKDGILPMYPTKTAPSAMSEMASNVYKTAVTSAPQLVQIPSGQFQPQYVGYPQMHHPSQSISVASSAGANYNYEYVNASNDQAYYSQHPATGYPPQYQTMTPAAAMALSDASKRVLPAEQQMKTSQP